MSSVAFSRSDSNTATTDTAADAVRWPRRRPFEKRDGAVTSFNVDKAATEMDLEAVIRLINTQPVHVWHEPVALMNGDHVNEAVVDSCSDRSSPSSVVSGHYQKNREGIADKMRFYLSKVVHGLLKTVGAVHEEPENPLLEINPGEFLTVEAFQRLTEYFSEAWVANGPASYFAFEGLLLLLELSLSHANELYELFNTLVSSLGQDNVELFLYDAFPYIIESDMRNQSGYMDMLFMYLSVYSVTKHTGLARSLIKNIPYFSGFYLCQYEKRFQELYRFIRKSQNVAYDTEKGCIVGKLSPHYLAYMHLPERKVIVSNAPPIKLKRREVRSNANPFQCEASAGGLVSGLQPSLQPDDVWVSWVDTSIVGPESTFHEVVKYGHIGKLRRTTSFQTVSLVDEDKPPPTEKQSKLGIEYLWEKTENDLLSLRRQLDSFSSANFIINPLILLREDHQVFYNRISNGLLWPALHALDQYIIDDYKGPDGLVTLESDWMKYIKVNHHFAIYAARSARPQDVLWIHDYHLLMVGGIVRIIDADLMTGFFLHIPFRLTEQFLNAFPEQSLAIIQALLFFNRVGFQTQRDCEHFIGCVERLVSGATVRLETVNTTSGSSTYSISYRNHVVDVGVFPISIKSSAMLELACDVSLGEEAEALKRDIMLGRSGKLFFSVERFDYTKGIEEKLRALQRYFRQNPGRASSDVFYQIACSGRGDVSSYREYQAVCKKLVEEINAEFENATEPHLKPIYLDTANYPQEKLIPFFKAADVIVVTPLADGMNLVMKEAVICNAAATFVLSTGAGVDNEFHCAGLSNCYVRVEDIKNTEEFALAIEKAWDLPKETAKENGQKLFSHVQRYDVAYWLDSYLDAGWSHDVVKQRSIEALDELVELMNAVRRVRCEIVNCLLEDCVVKEGIRMSLENAVRSIEDGLSDDYKKRLLLNKDTNGRESAMAGNSFVADVKDEVRGLKEDLCFLRFVKSNTEVLADFNKELASFHPLGETAFFVELERLLRFLKPITAKGIDVMITDWDGTMKNYCSTYCTNMQPAYSAVILARFAARYTHWSAILTAGPLHGPGIMDLICIPDGYFCIGGSWGNEWLIRGKRVVNEAVFMNKKSRQVFADLLELLESKVIAQPQFAQFRRIGSGFQRKVDRITLGFQTKFKDIPEAISQKFLAAVLEQLREVDPFGSIFTVHKGDLDIELLLNSPASRAFNKADGVNLMLTEMGLSLKTGNVLICGDTISDLPMVEVSKTVNAQGTRAVFVCPESSPVVVELQKLLGTEGPDTFCRVTCPEVIHAAMAELIIEHVNLK